MHRLLITGAGGKIGRAIRAGLREQYATVRLLDRAAQDPAAAGEEVVTVDLNDRAATEAAVQGMDAVVHLAAISSEAPFDEILEGNVTTTYSVLRAARKTGVRRVVLASSNHVTGFYACDETIGPQQPVRPDSFYGVSKVFDEAIGRLYAEKFGLEVVCLRIGTFASRPRNRRHLSTWLSPRDCVELIRRSLEAPDVAFAVVYGVSANTRRFWTDDASEVLGYRPRDDAEDFAAEIEEASPDAHPEFEDCLQGGSFTRQDPDG
jgi:uronate dehydrogenase